MAYADKFELSADARKAANMIVRGLMEKAERERKIPETYVFWSKTDDPAINQELLNAGFMAYEFTEEEEVYSHRVDAEALREALGWTKH